MHVSKKLLLTIGQDEKFKFIHKVKKNITRKVTIGY